MWDDIKCFFGKHYWFFPVYNERTEQPSVRHRQCMNCHKKQELWFYSNRTSEWEEVYQGQPWTQFK